MINIVNRLLLFHFIFSKISGLINYWKHFSLIFLKDKRSFEFKVMFIRVPLNPVLLHQHANHCTALSLIEIWSGLFLLCHSEDWLNCVGLQKTQALSIYSQFHMGIWLPQRIMLKQKNFLLLICYRSSNLFSHLK